MELPIFPFVSPTNGSRQGGPFAPILFVFMTTEALISLINNALHDGNISGFQPKGLANPLLILHLQMSESFVGEPLMHNAVSMVSF